MRTIYLIILLCSLNAYAEPLRAVTEQLSNFQFINSTGEIDGFAVEAVNKLSHEAGYQTHLDIMPWARAYKLAQNEPNLMIFSMARTEQREAQFHWIGSLCRVPLYIWSLADNPTKHISGIDELKLRSFVVRQDSQFDQYLTSLSFTNLFRINDVEQTLGMLLKGRAEFTIHGNLQMNYILDNLGVASSQFKRLYRFEDVTSNLSLAFSKDTDVEVLDNYNAAFAAMEASETLSMLQNKWDILCL